MTVVDLHRHLWPAQLVEGLRTRSEPPCLRGATLVLADGEYACDVDGYGLERCLADLERDAIDLAVVSCPPTLGIEELPEREAAGLLEAYHAGALEAVAAAEGRLLAFAMARPRPGFVGATVAARALLDLDALAPVLDEVTASDGVLFVHPGLAQPRGGAPGWWTAVVDYTAQMQAAYAAWLEGGSARWPELRVLFAILAGGAPFQLERLHSRGVDVKRALAPTLFLDTASYGRRALELCLATYGGAQLVFGTDGPVLATAVSLEPIRAFGQAVTDAVCADNPRALLASRR
jgi:6-methylsalicylate decarboxylase